VKETARKTQRETAAPQEDTRAIDDPARLADEARATIEKNAAEIRAQRIPIATEPPTAYRP
jgi:hypothetical protein